MTMSSCGLLTHSVAFLLVLSPLVDAAYKLPSYIKPCSAKDKELNACALKSARDAVPHFLGGDRKYKVPLLDPLKIEKLNVDDGHGPLGLAFYATDAYVSGMKDLRLDAVNLNLNDKHVFYNAFVSHLEINCQYNVSGKILLLSITGAGDGNITMKDLFFTYSYDYDLKKDDDGLEFLYPKNGHLEYNITRLYMHLDNLFNGDKLLGETTNKFLNENWQEVQTSVGPIVAESISEVIRQILTNIFAVVPMSEAFLDY